MQHDRALWARRVGLGSGLVVFPHRNCFGWRLLRHRVRCVGILGGHPDGLRQTAPSDLHQSLRQSLRKPAPKPAPKPALKPGEDFCRHCRTKACTKACAKPAEACAKACGSLRPGAIRAIRAIRVSLSCLRGLPERRGGAMTPLEAAKPQKYPAPSACHRGRGCFMLICVCGVGFARPPATPLCQGSCPLLYFCSISQVGGIG